MRLTTRRMMGLAVAALLAAHSSLVARAQAQGTEAAEDVVDDAGGGGDEAEAAKGPAVPVKPRPADIMPLAAERMLLDLQKVESRYVAVGDRGNIVLSPDGTDWKQVAVPVRSMLTAVHFPDAQNGCAVGHDAVILVTSDGGTTWALRQFKPEWEKPLLDVLFLDAKRGFAVGAYGLFQKTTDGGASWSDVDAPSICEDEMHLNAIVRLNDGRLLIVGEDGMLAVSTDDGATWQRIESPYESSLFGAVSFGDRGAVIHGMRGNVFVSADVGQGEWRKLPVDSVQSMFGGTVLADGRIALVGVNGFIFVIDASGTKVTVDKTDTGTPLATAIPFGEGLLAVGESGVQIMKTLQ
jgi:photosystem II stability/assembly factor-like uncharacterized protein